jgi:hypothetical protein
LEEINGVVTPQSFEILVQWVCLGRVVFRECAPDVAITTAIEFARLADVCRITGMESLMAEHIKTIILASKSGQWAEPLNALAECFRALSSKVSRISRHFWLLQPTQCKTKTNIRKIYIYNLHKLTHCTLGSEKTILGRTPCRMRSLPCPSSSASRIADEHT